MNEQFKAWVETVHPAARGGTWTAVDRGGSDRQFCRGGGAAEGLVALTYGAERAENAAYADCAAFLRARGVRVPAVIAHDAAERRMLMEDAGTEDLWTHRNLPWPQRRKLYAAALEQAAILHAIDADEAATAGVLREPFDAALYRWEQDYFFEHFLGKDQAESLRAAVPLEKQAEELAAMPRVPVHRDFQSQNIMVRDGAVTLIDFQGLRAGLAGYDVASLLFDPYVPMETAERAELASLYAELAGRRDRLAWDGELLACARQRLMQALGAYGFLGRVKGKTHFLEHVPVAAERLAGLCDEENEWQPLAVAIRRATSSA